MRYQAFSYHKVDPHAQKTSKTSNMGLRSVKSINQSIIRCYGFIFVFIIFDVFFS